MFHNSNDLRRLETLLFIITGDNGKKGSDNNDQSNDKHDGPWFYKPQQVCTNRCRKDSTYNQSQDRFPTLESKKEQEYSCACKSNKKFCCIDCSDCKLRRFSTVNDIRSNNWSPATSTY